MATVDLEIKIDSVKEKVRYIELRFIQSGKVVRPDVIHPWGFVDDVFRWRYEIPIKNEPLYLTYEVICLDGTYQKYTKLLQ